jgi:hypothetical protein
MHTYIVYQCKTPGCPGKHVIREVGEGEKIPTSIPLKNLPVFECTVCHKPYNYEHSSWSVYESDRPLPHLLQPKDSPKK